MSAEPVHQVASDLRQTVCGEPLKRQPRTFDAGKVTCKACQRVELCPHGIPTEGDPAWMACAQCGIAEGRT